MEPALKQRLVGAAVLVALAVIFLPMLVQGPAPESGVANVPLDAPSAPQGEFETRDLPLVAPEGAPAEGALGMENMPPTNAPPTPAPANDVATVASAAPATVATLPQTAAATTQPLPEQKPATAPAAAAMFPAPTAGGNYAVHFGSYATAAAADKLIASLRASQLPAYREAATVGGKTMQRVRIGPFATRPQAEDARLRAAHVRDDVGARVVALDAESAADAKTVAAAKPADKPAAPKPEAPKPLAAKPDTAKPVAAAASNTGFAVQLAAFSKSADANALRDKLRAAGFSAFTEVVNTDKGALTRVRVGPVLNRAEADQLKAQVKSKVGLDGIVRPHP
ncbi:SPOR domain-containing protein [Lysobacter sp. A6]|uniref:SPOR domain-containing protein n=1 Tax=Noviluteimonas lactosilytica TaxID=2888523 RepID=A0ABS8JFA5_9GAMM|nr:SPOR domain-containing protein [Lysobacter lactosilyticus]MCC8362272.1 SPOR domain-containing protein [Lysobacter lactosilyticus]